MPETDVTDPSSEPQELDQTAPESSTVNSDVEPEVVDRPVVNLKAEFDRKHSRLENKIEELTAIILEQARSRNAPPPAAAEPDDEELARNAILGDPKALVALNTRSENRVRQAMSAEQQADAFVNAQLGAIAGKYPMLSDPSSPLRAKVMEAKRTLLGFGYPDSKALTLEAIKLAIIDNPELARPGAQEPSVVEPVRRESTNSMSSLPGNAPRRKTASPAAPVVSKEEAAIAKRMGVDPIKAKANFEKRMREGKSGLSLQLYNALSTVKES